jgi:hypothetical protein
MTHKFRSYLKENPTRLNYKYKLVNRLKPNGNYIYQPFNNQQLFVLCLWVLHDSQCKQRLFP